MSERQQDEAFMRRAIEVGARNPDHPFGALLVDPATGTIVSEGLNDAGTNPVHHGEIVAIERYAANEIDPHWSELTLYTTAEPCCMCQGAILWAGIPRVVFGTSIETLTMLGWQQIQISARDVVSRTPNATCVVAGGVLESECDALFRRASKNQPET